MLCKQKQTKDKTYVSDAILELIKHHGSQRWKTSCAYIKWLKENSFCSMLWNSVLSCLLKTITQDQAE